MKKFISTLSCLLVVCLACFAFVGCSGSKDKKPEATPTAQDEQTGQVNIITAVNNFINATSLTASISDYEAFYHGQENANNIIFKFKNPNTSNWEVLCEGEDHLNYITPLYNYYIRTTTTPPERTKENNSFIFDRFWDGFKTDTFEISPFFTAIAKFNPENATIKSVNEDETTFDYVDQDGQSYVIHINNSTNKITRVTFTLHISESFGIPVRDVSCTETYSYATLPEILFDVSGEWN